MMSKVVVYHLTGNISDNASDAAADDAAAQSQFSGILALFAWTGSRMKSSIAAAELTVTQVVDGEFAAYTTIWIDSTNHYGIFEDTGFQETPYAYSPWIRYL